MLRQDYVRTAWAKGLADRRVVLKHCLKNALIPVVTVLGIQVAQILSGTVVFESIFGLPGMGRVARPTDPVLSNGMARPLEAELQQDWGGATARGGILCRALDVIGGFCRQKPLGAVGAAIILALRIMAAFAEAIAPYAYDEQIPGARLRPAARTCSAPTT